MTEKNRKQVGTKLREIRLNKGLIQSEVAQASGISTNYYARVERGEVSISLDRFKKIASALGVKSSQILD